MNSKIIIGIIIIIISIGVAVALSTDLSISPDISNPVDMDSDSIVTRNLNDGISTSDSP